MDASPIFTKHSGGTKKSKRATFGSPFWSYILAFPGHIRRIPAAEMRVSGIKEGQMLRHLISVVGANGVPFVVRATFSFERGEPLLPPLLCQYNALQTHFLYISLDMLKRL